MAAEPHSVRHESIRKVYGRLNNVPKVDEKEFLTEDECHEFKISEDWTKRIVRESVLAWSDECHLWAVQDDFEQEE